MAESPGKFRSRVALVTGASGGIGREVCRGLAREGASVALLARDPAKLEKIEGVIRNESGSQTLIVQSDVRSPSSIEQGISKTMDRFGRIDILINCAGVISYKPLVDLDVSEIQEMMSVNFFGTTACIKAVLPGMIRRGDGHIVNIASTAGRRGFPMESGYCASKFAVVGLTEALRMELYGTDVRVSLICPGIVDTPMAEGFLSRPGIRESIRPLPPGRIAEMVLKSIRDGLPEMIAPASTRWLIRLNLLFPRLVDRVIQKRMKAIAEILSKTSPER